MHLRTTLCAALLLVASSAFAQTQTYTVLGSADLWLAGQLDGTHAGASSVGGIGNDTAPAQSPTFASGLAISGGSVLTFSVSGTVDNGGGNTALSPDGSNWFSHAAGPENGVSDVYAPINSLIGVFLTDTTPSGTSTPAAIDFQTLGLGFATLSPELNQVFFIGDGVTETGKGDPQLFIAPSGAARLYLGSMDGWDWNNNSGEFTVTATAIPEPSAYAAFCGIAALAIVVIRRRRK